MVSAFVAALLLLGIFVAGLGIGIFAGARAAIEYLAHDAPDLLIEWKNRREKKEVQKSGL